MYDDRCLENITTNGVCLNGTFSMLSSCPQGYRLGCGCSDGRHHWKESIPSNYWTGCRTGDPFCYGRPYMTADQGYIQAKTTQLHSQWIADLHPFMKGISQEKRQQLSEQWLQSALSEHASVASFSRFTLQLLSVGAPPELIHKAQQAAVDEIRHAQLAFGLASAYAGHSISPGNYDSHIVSVNPDMFEMCTLTAMEGCVSETFATLSAAAQLQDGFRCQGSVAGDCS